METFLCVPSGAPIPRSSRRWQGGPTSCEVSQRETGSEDRNTGTHDGHDRSKVVADREYGGINALSAGRCAAAASALSSSRRVIRHLSLVHQHRGDRRPQP